MNWKEFTDTCIRKILLMAGDYQVTYSRVNDRFSYCLREQIGEKEGKPIYDEVAFGEILESASETAQLDFLSQIEEELTYLVERRR